MTHNISRATDPAFPVLEQGVSGQTIMCYEGMTIREYFAAKAIQGLTASIGQHDVTDAGELAHDAVRIADALIAELAKENG